MDKNFYKNFEEGYYDHDGELVYISKNSSNWLTINRPYIYKGKFLEVEVFMVSYKSPQSSFNLNILTKVDPKSFLRNKINSFNSFIAAVEKEKNKANLSARNEGEFQLAYE